MIASSVDWTNVLVALIAGLPAIIAAVGVLLVRQQIKTPSGDPIGHVAERAHETGIANNLLLRRMNGNTEPATHDGLKEAGAQPLQVPSPEAGT